MLSHELIIPSLLGSSQFIHQSIQLYTFFNMLNETMKRQSIWNIANGYLAFGLAGLQQCLENVHANVHGIGKMNCVPYL